YCIRTLNYLIGSLKLQTIPPIVLLEDITVEVLLQVHCKLMGWDFAKEYIPSRRPRDDAQRIILSLKDKYGTDKFDALVAERIVEKHPVHLRFLIENYHLIHDHQYKRSLGLSTATNRSSSGNHLAVSQPSDTELKAGDSFYIFPSTLPPQSSVGVDSTSDESEPQGEATSFLDSDFETVDDFVNKTKRPLSSSPIDSKKWNQSSLITDPNVSSIKGSPSKKIQRTIGLTQSYNNTGRSPSKKTQQTGGSTQSYNNTGRSPSKTGGSTQSYSNTGRSPSKKTQQTGGSTQSYNNTDRSSTNDKLTERTKHASSTAGPISRQKPPASKHTSRDRSQDTKDTDMRSIRSKNSEKRNSETFKESSTKTLSLPDLSNKAVSNKENKELPAAEIDSALALHQSIRKHLTDSWDAIDSDIKKLKEKTSCPELKDECPPQPIPNLRWMMPVDLRFPYYPGGIIHPKCKRFSKSQMKTTQSSKPSQADFADSYSSTAVESRGRTQFFDETDTE
ncbi:hypothetical protein Ocin01_11227, partial [Orchesella cincta]